MRAGGGKGWGDFAAHWNHVAPTPDILKELLRGATSVTVFFKASQVILACSKAGTELMKGIAHERCPRGEPIHLGPELGG